MTYPDPFYGNTPGTQYYGGNQAMAFGWDDALAAGGGVLSALGGGQEPDNYAARQQRDMTLLQIMQRYIEWQRSQGLTEGNAAMGIQRDIERSPMRDQLYYNLSARLGLPPQQLGYSPGGATPGLQDMSGNPMGQFANRQRQYTPGAGGVDMSQRIQHDMLNNLGYGNNGNQSLYNQQTQATGDDLPSWMKNFFAQKMGGGGSNLPGTMLPGGHENYQPGLAPGGGPGSPRTPNIPSSALPPGAPGVGGPRGFSPWRPGDNPYAPQRPRSY